jgi:ribose transport system ATP-binding protein
MSKIPALIEVDRVSKRFPGVLALDAVSFNFRLGEVHAVIGENGAGKSTLMNILAGELRPDAGTIRVGGEPVSIPSPLASQKLGIAVVYQELMLCMNLSAAENVMLPQIAPRLAATIMPRDEMRERARAALAQLGIADIDLEVPAGGLTMAEKQLIEIARAIGQKARILVLDEPNSALSPYETGQLFDIIRKLRADGVTVIYVSHHLQEVLSIADRISIMRDGRAIETVENRNIGEDYLIHAMVGRELDTRDHWALGEGARADEAPVILSVRDFTSHNIHDLSFSVRAGEILGVAGLPDSGKDGLGEALLGLLPRSGAVLVNGKPIKPGNPSRAIRAGLALIPADRRAAGAILSMSVADNVVAASLPRFSVAGLLRRGRIQQTARAQVARLDARIASISQKLATLSGGNQQKIILSRGLVTNPRVLILHEPTRGIDVGAKAEIYRILREIAREGIAILMISSELPELILNAARVIVMRNGCIAGEVTGTGITEEAILAHALAA